MSILKCTSGKKNLTKGGILRIIDQMGPVTFITWDQISGKVKRAHVNNLKLGGLEE